MNILSKVKRTLKSEDRLQRILFKINRFINKKRDEIKISKLQNKNLEDVQYVIDLPSHTVEENRKKWDFYDWSERGEEWTKHAKEIGLDPIQWKNNLIDNMMLKYFKQKKNSVILEIGPGAGRWSEILIDLTDSLILADISKTCISICKKRFKNSDNIQYHLINKRLDFLEIDSIDYVWSYDVFVHINPSDIEKYIVDISRILKPGGIAVIHHAGENSQKNKSGWRAFMTAKKFKEIIEQNGMILVEQNEILPHADGDIISVFKRFLE